jgi:hypothetical protein
MAPAQAQPAFERDPVKVDSKHYKVELENDRVRVVRIRYADREKSCRKRQISLSTGLFRFPLPLGQNRRIDPRFQSTDGDPTTRKLSSGLPEEIWAHPARGWFSLRSREWRTGLPV